MEVRKVVGVMRLEYHTEFGWICDVGRVRIDVSGPYGNWFNPFYHKTQMPESPSGDSIPRSNANHEGVVRRCFSPRAIVVI